MLLYVTRVSDTAVCVTFVKKKIDLNAQISLWGKNITVLLSNTETIFLNF